MSEDDWSWLVGSGQPVDTPTLLCIENDSVEPVGSVVRRIHNDEIELSYWLAATERRKGYAAEALLGAVGWCGASHPGTPLVLEIHPGNAASIAVAERSGFSFDASQASCAPYADDNGQVAIHRGPA